MPTFAFAYIIVDADVVSRYPSNITGMDPRKHVPASVGGRYPQECERLVKAFRETEDDDQYQFGYLGDECGDARYYPYGCVDSEAVNEPPPDIEDVRGVWGSVAASRPTGLGMHRKWVGELDLGAWRAFAYAYDIELDDRGFPTEDNEHGSRPEPASVIDWFGMAPSLRYDNTEGWDYPGFGYGGVESVISSSIDVAIAVEREDHAHERGQLQPYERTGDVS